MPPPLRPRIAIWITAALGALHLISYLAYSQFRGDRNNVNGQKVGGLLRRPKTRSKMQIGQPILISIGPLSQVQPRQTDMAL